MSCAWQPRSKKVEKQKTTFVETAVMTIISSFQAQIYKTSGTVDSSNPVIKGKYISTES
jgi:hypothetical protein